MSCSNKIDDLEDLAQDLFEFEDGDLQEKPKKERAIKKKKLRKE